MLKKIGLTILTILILSGCESISKMTRMWYMGPSYNYTIDRQIDSMKLYCDVSGFNNCISYYQCIFDEYQNMRTDERIMKVMTNGYFFPMSSYKKADYIELTEKVYNKILINDEYLKGTKSIYELEDCEGHNNRCVFNKYKKIKTVKDITILFQKAYNELKYNSDILQGITRDRRYSQATTVSLGYLIYTHNTCASITGDKTYNIDKYMPLIKERLEIE